MSNDVKFYLAIHAPFALWMLLLVLTSRTKLWIVSAMIFAALHAITISSYFMKLGDDFAILHYWSLYFAMPALVIYLNLWSEEPAKRKLKLYIPIALAIPLTSIAGIVLALSVTPMDWR